MGILEVSSTEYIDVKAEGEVLRVDIKSTYPWLAGSHDSWCIPYNETGEGDAQLVISVVPNIENVERETTITVSGSGSTKNIRIRQQAAANAGTEHHYELPVIFHVFYQNAGDPFQHPSAERLWAVLDNVNRLYQGSAGSMDMNLSFVPATLNPDGREMDTPGVEYVEWTGTYPIDCEAFMNNYSGNNKQYMWDPNLFINVMVYEFAPSASVEGTILGVSHTPYCADGGEMQEGFSTLPYSYLKLSNLGNAHCVSLNSSYIYSNTISNNVSATLAHELGHYLGLYHTFSEPDGDTPFVGCVDSDYCSDTPTYDKDEYDEWVNLNSSLGLSFATLAMRVNCLTGERFTARNIMDYAYCYSDCFTAQQRARVRHVLTYGLLVPGPKLIESAGVRSAPDGVVDFPVRWAK